jgi:hypothetical protein
MKTRSQRRRVMMSPSRDGEVVAAVGLLKPAACLIRSVRNRREHAMPLVRCFNGTLSAPTEGEHGSFQRRRFGTTPEDLCICARK